MTETRPIATTASEDDPRPSPSCPRPTRKRPRPQSSQRRRRLREIERDAARRTLNGNGMNGSLPPLPVADNDDDVDGDDGECDPNCGGGDNSNNKGDDGGAGFGTLFGHPYGALPYGNIHLAVPPPSPSQHTDTLPPSTAPPSSQERQWHPDIVRHQGLGPHLRNLNDEQLLTILSFVDGPSLARGIVACSRFLYVAGHHEELWRDLVLRRWGSEEEGFVVPSPDGSDEEEGCKKRKRQKENTGCWKDIYAYNHYHNQKANKSTSTSSSDVIPTLSHTPISIAGIYSDTFFRSFLCRSFALQPSWLTTHTVPTLPHSEVTTTRFIKEYEETNIPLLIKGASKSWPALNGKHKWTKSYLLKVSKGKTFRATSGAAPLPATFALPNYFNYCASSTEEAPLYLFDRTFATKVPQLLEDFDPKLKETCPWWSRGNEESGHDLFSVLGERGRPDYQWLIVGPKRSGSCFHIDPNCTHAWNAPILGRKRWIFYPPSSTPPGVYPSPSGDDVCMPISIGEWFLTYWDAHVERRSDPDVGRRPLECTACPGDVLFVPHGWWHMVLNIGDDDDVDDSSDVMGGDADNQRGVSVALTRNYVSASNLSDVLRFLDTRVSQISGCRDRKEAVAPEKLGEEFRKGLLSVQEDTVEEAGGVGSRDQEEKKCDDNQNDECAKKGKWVYLLEKAEKQAKKGWGCDAWVDLPTSCTSNNGEGCKKPSGDTSTGMSILARAKQQQPSSCMAGEGTGMNVGNDSGSAIAGTSSSGFSFSFL